MVVRRFLGFAAAHRSVFSRGIGTSSRVTCVNIVRIVFRGISTQDRDETADGAQGAHREVEGGGDDDDPSSESNSEEVLAPPGMPAEARTKKNLNQSARRNVIRVLDGTGGSASPCPSPPHQDECRNADDHPASTLDLVVD